MNRWLSLVLLLIAAGGPRTTGAAEPPKDRLPNIVLIFADDQGYADVGCYGARGFATPNLDALAAQGVRFTDFYVAQAVCSSSRAALLTGCYPNRVGITGALSPKSNHGIHDNEMTLGQLVKQSGYAAAALGKWHLGHHAKFLPTHHGFDQYFGLLYSNDMHPENGKEYPPLPLVEQDKVVQTNPDQSQLTTWYTERAVKFIEQNAERPFFLYVAHSMPHVPLHVSDKFRGKTDRGLYGDVIEEIDWSVGQILEALKRLRLDEHTLVIFSSDNGPWLTYGDHAGSAGPLREGKATTFEGGVREPCIMRWAGKIPAGSICHEPTMTIDISPTIARLVGARPSADRVIDGRDIWPLISGQPGAKSPHEVLYFYWINELQALRSGRWKLHLPHSYQHLAEAGSGGKPGRYADQKLELSLYDLEADIGETTNVAAQHPDVVQRLMEFAEKARQDLGDSATKRRGQGVRSPGQI